jgi:hypothetical protein
MTEQPAHCPRCNSGRVAAILYGLPDFGDELDRRLEAGEIVLGGCVVHRDDPAWHCRDCEHRWGELDRPDGWFDADDGATE